MNPDTNRFEELSWLKEYISENANQQENPSLRPDQLHRPDGTPVPDHWSQYTVGEIVEVKGYTFKVAYIGETNMLLEAHGPLLVGADGR